MLVADLARGPPHHGGNKQTVKINESHLPVLYDDVAVLQIAVRDTRFV